MARVILHLDMDAFYASVEQRDDPSLRGRPVIVGAPPSQRGVVCAASYEARRFGVRSAMPSVTAGRLCPDGVFLRPRMEAYRAESRIIMALFREVTGDGVLVEQVSVDEAYVDVTSSRALLACGEPGKSGPPGVESAEALLDQALPLARRLKERVREERGLTTSVGIATNKLLAKLASDFRKPDGLMLIRESEKVGFLRPLPVQAIHGVGPVTAGALSRAGILTIGDLQDFPGDLRALVGAWGPQLRGYAFGEDARPVDPGDEVKSISSENTFRRDTEDRPTLRACLREQAGEIAASLRRRRLAAHTVQVKVRYGDFTTRTRQVSVEEPVCEGREIYRLACHLLARERLVHRPLRLLGLGVSGLVDSRSHQLWLPMTGWEPGRAGRPPT